MAFSDADLFAIIKTYPGDFAVYRFAAGKLQTLYASPALPAMSGMDDEEYRALTDEDATRIIVDADVPRVSAAMGESVAQGKDCDITYRIKHNEREFVWVHARSRVLDMQGDSLVVIVAFVDASSEANDQMELMERTDEVVYVIDRETHELLYANKAAREWKGGRALVGQQCYHAMNGLDEPCPWCFVPRMQGKSIHLEEANLPGTDTWLRIDGYAIRWRGRSAAAIYCTDISSAKREQANLEINRDELQMVIDNLPVGIGVRELHDGKQVASMANDRMCALLGIKRSDFVKDESSTYDRVHPDDATHLAETMAALTAPDVRRMAVFRYYPQGRKKGLQPRWYRLLGRSIVRGGTTMTFTCMSDVTTEKRADEQAANTRRMYETAVDEAKLVVWEYDIPNKRITMSENQFTAYDHRKFGMPRVTENAPDSLVPYIDPGSVDAFLDMYRKIQEGAPRASCEVWYKLKPGQEPRCEHILYTTAYDVDGKPIKAFGIGQNITARKMEEEKFNRLYSDLANANPDALGSFRINLTKNLCSDGQSSIPSVLEQGVSGTADGYLEANAMTVLEGPEREAFRATFNRQNLLASYRRGTSRLSTEYPTRFHDGRIHWLEGIITMAQNPTTGDVEAVTYALDATDRIKDREVTTLIAEQGYDFVGIADLGMRTFEMRIAKDVYASQGLHRIVSLDQAIDALRSAHVSKADAKTFQRDIAADTVRAALKKDGIYVVSYRSAGKAGNQLRKQITFSWLEEQYDQVLVTQGDVTATYRQERARILELEKERRSHQHTTALLQSILDAAPTAMFWKDVDRRFEGANKAFLDFYGFASLSDIVGKNDEDMGWHPDPGPYKNDELRVIEEGVSTHRVPGINVRGGKVIHIVASKSPRYENGKIVGLVGAFEDVTREFEHAAEVAKLNASLKRALDAAEKANAAEQVFLSNVSHDMRTPLNGILGFTDLAINAQDPAQKQDYLGKIGQSGKLMLALVNDVLDMSKIESGKITLHPQPFASRGLLESIVDSVSVTAKQQKVHLKHSMQADYPRFISTDRLRLQQVALNLLSNAIKYTPEGGTASIDVSVVKPEQHGCNTLVCVSDTGIGMSAEFQKRMFEPFSQEHQSSMYGMQGTGLGLTIVKNIVELMDGHIEVESKLGKGTTFKVYLPLQQVDSADDEAPQAASPARSIAGKHVLLCEDNDLNAEIAEVILRERAGAVVERARDGEEGVNLFAKSKPGAYDAVLMDLRMPVMGGIEAAKTIRAMNRPDAKTVPILAMTADAFAEDAQRCIDAGMNAHLPKPLEPKKLIETLAGFCSK